jgi:hypothetical protein
LEHFLTDPGQIQLRVFFVFNLHNLIGVIAAWYPALCQERQAIEQVCKITEIGVPESNNHRFGFCSGQGCRRTDLLFFAKTGAIRSVPAKKQFTGFDAGVFFEGGGEM